MHGIFISFEGIEGSGKSTQIKRLSDYLASIGKSTVLTREPGGTPIGDQVRLILLNPANKSMIPITELLLYVAARAQHVGEVIRPALTAGKVVLTDRYADATTAYQGAARQLSGETLRQLHAIGTENLQPDITFLLDLPAEDGLARAKSRNLSGPYSNGDRLEQETLNFHQRVRNGYLELAKSEPNRFHIIDALKPVETIHQEIVNHVVHYIGSSNAH